MEWRNRMKPHWMVAVASSLGLVTACSSTDTGTQPGPSDVTLNGDVEVGFVIHDVVDIGEQPDQTSQPDITSEIPDTGSWTEDGATDTLDVGASPEVFDVATDGADISSPQQDAAVGDGTSAADAGDSSSAADAGDSSSDVPVPVCQSGETTCVDGDVSICKEDGSGFEDYQTCLETEICILGACASLCEEAAKDYLSEGCEFFAVSTVNEYLAPAMQEDFAVIVANPSDNPPASVQVSRAGSVLSQAVVAPGDTHVFTLTMVADLVEAETTVLASQAAFIVTSTVPVAAYQFNPLNFQDAVNASFSFSNDASLLLPTHALGDDYRAMSWPTWGEFVAWTSGFVAIAAVQDGTTLTFTASGPTMPGDVAGLAAGESISVSLNRGDVLQFLGETYNNPLQYVTEETCAGPGWVFDGNMTCEAVSVDLTGSVIQTTAPVAVFSGHDCLRIPYDKKFCDHVEEQLLPRSSWDDKFFLAAPQRPDSSATASAQYRILGLEDETEVTISPEVAGPFNLSEGQVASFVTDVDVAIFANKKIALTQALLSAGALDPPALDSSDVPLSDPAASIGIPYRQARSAYVFQTPDTYESNWVNVVRLIGDEVVLDDVPLTGFSQIASTPYKALRVAVEPGVHRIESVSDLPFTIMIYGYAAHTSYMYPGGLRVLP